MSPRPDPRSSRRTGRDLLRGRSRLVGRALEGGGSLLSRSRGGRRGRLGHARGLYRVEASLVQLVRRREAGALLEALRVRLLLNTRRRLGSSLCRRARARVIPRRGSLRSCGLGSRDAGLGHRRALTRIHRSALGRARVLGSGHTSGCRIDCLLYTSPSPRDKRQSRMPSSA